MCWSYTHIHEKQRTNTPLGHWICKETSGPGIKDYGFAVTWSVREDIINNMAMQKGLSPYALAPDDIKNLILEYYTCL